MRHYELGRGESYATEYLDWAFPCAMLPYLPKAQSPRVCLRRNSIRGPAANWTRGVPPLDNNPKNPARILRLPGHRGGGKPHAWVLATPSARLASPRNCTPLECTEMIRCYCNRGRLCPRVNTAESQAFFQMSRVARIQATREIGIRQRRRSILPLVLHDTSPSNMPPP